MLINNTKDLSQKIRFACEWAPDCKDADCGACLKKNGFDVMTFISTLRADGLQINPDLKVKWSDSDVRDKLKKLGAC